MAQITIFNVLTGATTAARDLLFADDYLASGGIAILSARSQPTFRHARRRGCIQSKLSGRVMTEVALQTVNLVRRVQGVITHTLVNASIYRWRRVNFSPSPALGSGNHRCSIARTAGCAHGRRVIICGQATSNYRKPSAPTFG